MGEFFEEIPLRLWRPSRPRFFSISSASRAQTTAMPTKSTESVDIDGRPRRIDAELVPTARRNESAVEISGRRGRALGGWVGWLAAALLLSFGIRSTIVQAYLIPSASMETTLQIDDHLLVGKRLLDLNGINEGDIIVFERPPTFDAISDELIKRVVGVGGDVVQARGGVVHVNGRPLVEPYVSSSTDDFGPVQVPTGYLFVMGDNRTQSADSRVFGPIPESSVVGSAFARTWPLSRIGAI